MKDMQVIYSSHWWAFAPVYGSHYQICIAAYYYNSTNCYNIINQTIYLYLHLCLSIKKYTIADGMTCEIGGTLIISTQRNGYCTLIITSFPSTIPRLLFKIEVWFLCKDSYVLCASILKLFCLLVCRSGYEAFFQLFVLHIFATYSCCHII